MADLSQPPSGTRPRLSPLGTGWSFPPSFDRFSGTVKLSSDIENVRENLHLLFATDMGERVMLANYGTLMRERVFAALTETTSNQLKLEIQNVIAEWEPRIDVLEIQINDRQESEGACELAVIFQLRSSGASGSMIYPFYATTGEQMPPDG